MTRVLITAFEPYDRWTDNSSWAALMDLTSWYDGDVELTTRRYPVELQRMSEALRSDISDRYDLAIHLGQSPASPLIKLEAVGLNLRTGGSPLLPQAPEAYRSRLPLSAISDELLAAGIPTEVSHHAGTFLCNAALYLSLHYCQSLGLSTDSLFVHLPLSPSQSAQHVGERLPSMSTPVAATAVALIMQHAIGSRVC